MTTQYDEFQTGPIATADAMTALDALTWEKRFTSEGSILIENTGESGAIVTIETSPILKGSNFGIELLAETVIAAGGKKSISFTAYVPRIRVCARSETPGVSTTVQALGSAI